MTAPTFLHEFNEANILSLKKSISGRPRPHCIIGRGLGNQVYSKCDYSWKGIWLFEQYDVANGFADTDGLLKKYTDAEWDIRQQDYLYDIELKPGEDGQAIGVKQGDLCRVNVSGEPLTVLEAKKVDSKADGIVSVQLGSTKPDFRKLWEARSSGSSGYADYYLWPTRNPKTGSDSGSFRDLSDNTCNAGIISITMPTKALNATLKRVLLDVSITMDEEQDTLHRWGIVITVDGATNRYTVFPNYLVDPSGTIQLTDIDITDLVTAGSANSIRIYLYLHEEYWETHADCTEHPVVAFSISVKFLKRLFGP